MMMRQQILENQLRDMRQLLDEALLMLLDETLDRLNVLSSAENVGHVKDVRDAVRSLRQQADDVMSR